MLRKTETKSAVKIGNVSLYVDLARKAVRAGRAGKAIDTAAFYASMSKGEARKLRKKLRAEGYFALAAVSRAS